MNRKYSSRHAGQAWYQGLAVIEDLSVTCNLLGYPQSCIEPLKETLSIIDRYPPADWEPYRTQLFRFLGLEDQAGSSSGSLLLGNGASELIDVLMRYLSSSGVSSYATGPAAVQYNEYERSAKLCGMVESVHSDTADVHFIVNPNNPTGSFLEYNTLKSYIEERTKRNAVVIIDESMLPWFGATWKNQSILSELPWVHEIKRKKGVDIYTIHSWTKIWSCCGIRIGSLYCPCDELALSIRDLLVPWNVNLLALHFLSHAIRDEQFMKKTWVTTRSLRLSLSCSLKSICDEWRIYGEEWLPWIWLDVLKPSTAKRFVDSSVDCGLPTRLGAVGYGQGSFVRIRVCSSEHENILFHSLRVHGIIG